MLSKGVLLADGSPGDVPTLQGQAFPVQVQTGTLSSIPLVQQPPCRYHPPPLAALQYTSPTVAPSMQSAAAGVVAAKAAATTTQPTQRISGGQPTVALPGPHWHA